VTATDPVPIFTNANPGRYPGAAGPSPGSAGSRDLLLTGVIVVDRDPDWTFRELHEPEMLLACVPGASLTRLLDDRRFEARILVGAGPFKFAYTGVGRIVASNPRLRTASIALVGRSTAHMPAVRVRMSMVIRGHPRGSEIQMTFQVGIADPRRLLTHGLIDSIARDLVDRTINRVKRKLEETPPGTSDPAA
jgi:carbon monoxide dehydrogenase subunit G